MLLRRLLFAVAVIFDCIAVKSHIRVLLRVLPILSPCLLAFCYLLYLAINWYLGADSQLSPDSHGDAVGPAAVQAAVLCQTPQWKATA